MRPNQTRLTSTNTPYSVQQHLEYVSNKARRYQPRRRSDEASRVRKVEALVSESSAGAEDEGVLQIAQTTVEKYARQERNISAKMKLSQQADQMRWHFHHLQWATRVMQNLPVPSVDHQSRVTISKSRPAVVLFLTLPAPIALSTPKNSATPETETNVAGHTQKKSFAWMS